MIAVVGDQLDTRGVKHDRCGLCGVPSRQAHDGMPPRLSSVQIPLSIYRHSHESNRVMAISVWNRDQMVGSKPAVVVAGCSARGD